MNILQIDFAELLNLSPRLLTYVVIPLAILLLATIVSRIFRSVMHRYVEQRSQMLKVDPTRYRFFKNAVSFVIYLVAITIVFYSIPELRSVGVSLFAGAGIFAIIIGFASQAAFANIISGIFIVSSKPIRVGDFIKITDEYMGVVEDITLRHTVIRNNENRRIIIPNAVVNSQTIINSNIIDEKVCSLIEIGVSYDTDLDHAIGVLQDEIARHSLSIDNRTPEDTQAGVPRIVVRVMGFLDSSVKLRAYAWAATSMDAFVLRTDVYRTIKKRFDKEGIEIPYPYRTVVMKEANTKSISS